MENLSRATEVTANKLQAVLADFKVHGTIVAAHAGPTVTIFDFEPNKGIKTSKVIGLANDIARCMAVKSVRMAQVADSSAIAIEMPNKIREVVALNDLFETDQWLNHKGKLPIALGKDMEGDAVIADLAKMPHLLVAGMTGSGKSVGINTIICSLLKRFTSDELRLVLIDPKMLEMAQYASVPHLLAPVIVDADRAISALNWAVTEMGRRYRLMHNLKVRDISHYNTAVKTHKAEGAVITQRIRVGFDDNNMPEYDDVELDIECLPYIVIVIDEVANLMLEAGKELEQAVQQISQMARAAGIHLIMATQRPSVDVITGTIKANFPTRISFQVQSKIDSRTIIGEQGADQLLGNGDMLLLQGADLVRVQGAFIDDASIQNIVDRRSEGLEPVYNDAITQTEDCF